MSDFHNPYHFVPASPKAGPGQTAISNFTDQAKRPAHLTHDRYLAGDPLDASRPRFFSGRLICRLVTESPFVLGGLQSKKDGKADEVTVVEPFRLNGQPAIPASSLRGLISSLAEAASNSAFRVLANQRGYTYRRDAREGLSAIGMIVVRKQHGGSLRYSLRPLAVPHLRAPANAPFALAHTAPEQRGFTREMFPLPNLKLHIGSKESIRTSDFQERFKTFACSTRAFYGISRQLLPFSNWDGNNLLLQNAKTQHLKLLRSKDPRKPDQFVLLGHEVANGEAGLLPWQDVERLSESEQRNYVRGIVRVLGVTPERSEAVPDTKKHELFIPYTVEMEADFEASATADHPTSLPPEHWREFTVLQNAVDRFHRMADERTEDAFEEKAGEADALPYHPIGTSRRDQPPKEGEPTFKRASFRLKTGDLVYFRPTPDGTTIAEISLSSIWRGEVTTLHNDPESPPALPSDFIAAINPDLLPLGAQGNDPRSRKQNLTLAELLFGFVEQRRQAEGADEPGQAGEEALAMAFASRVRFAAARPVPPAADQWWHEEANGPARNGKNEQWFTLKILASPKPPAPALYFKNKTGQAACIAKKELTPEKHWPQGRKTYLHHGRDSRDWRTHPDNENDLRKQKMLVRPLRSGLTFWFHLDFDNLSETELQLLCFALQPAPEFRHKLGLGKPLGLGTVRIVPEGLFLIDRHRRYGADELLGSPRYHHAWASGSAAEWPPAYARERDELSRRPASNRPEAPACDRLARQFEETMSRIAPEIIHALKLLGDPQKLASPHVHYPQVLGVSGQNDEKTHFEWFVANDDRDGAHRSLAPITLKDEVLPTLPRLPKREKGRPPGGPRGGPSRDRFPPRPWR